MRTLNNIDFESYLESHETRKIAQHIETFDENLDDVYDYLINGSTMYGDCLPWQKTWNLWRARPSELTIWAGVNGNGKSTAQSMVAAYFQGKSVIASLEMPTKTTKAKIIRQTTGMSNPSKQYVADTVKKLNDKIYLFNQVGRVSPDTIKGLIVYSCEVLKVQHIFIDSLVKCGLGVDDYNRQKNFVSELAELAKEYKVHIHLVVHMRKGRDESDMPDKFDVKGAGEITDLADNLLIVSRNTAKQIALQNPANIAEWEGKPDGFIRVAKNRHGEFDGLFSFWYDQGSQQWLENKHSKPMVWNKWSANG